MSEFVDFLYRLGSLSIPLGLYAVHLERRLTRMETKIENLAICPIHDAACSIEAIGRARTRKKGNHV